MADYDVDEVLAQIHSVLDPAWNEAARADYEAMLAPHMEEIEKLLGLMKPGDRLELIDRGDTYRVVIVPKA